jgi:hypothetical protein
MILSSALQAYHRIASGQYLSGAAQLLPAALRNPLKAIGMGSEGVQTMYGNTTVAPSNVTTGMRVAQGLGFTPADVARAREQNSYEQRTASSETAARASVYDNLARTIVDMQAASRAGDRDTVNKLRQQYRDIALSAPKGMRIENEILSQHILALTNAELARLKKAPKALRSEMLQSPFVQPGAQQ